MIESGKDAASPKPAFAEAGSGGDLTIRRMPGGPGPRKRSGHMNGKAVAGPKAPPHDPDGKAIAGVTS